MRFPFVFYFFYNYGEGAKARRLQRVSLMDMVSERFILEYEVRDSIFFLSMIPCVLCVKCGRVFHSLSKDYSSFCLVFSVRFGVCFFAVYNKGMLFAFVNEHSSPVKRNSFINTLFLTFALVGIMQFSLLVIEFFYNLAGICDFLISDIIKRWVLIHVS